MYSEAEIAEIQDAISGKMSLSDSQINALEKRYANGEFQNYMLRLLSLSVSNPDVFDKIKQDERVKTYGHFGFFPETLGLVYGSEVSPRITLDHGDRGIVAILKHPEKNVVVKENQSTVEPRIAMISSDESCGPKQYKSLDGFITEKYIEAPLFPRLSNGSVSEEKMYSTGRRLGGIITKLHERDIYYNDTILSDDMGKSHLFVPDDSDALLFDYGTALLLEGHPENMTDEDVYNYLRTMPEFSFSFAMGGEPAIKQAIERYGTAIRGMTKEKVMERDMYFIDTGVYFGSGRLGKDISGPFMSGFKETFVK
ncbi:MAG: hypothetical protein V1813_02970 [Candidatus Aenigmatarchaeota archaeon]